ncbi:MAG: ankyrin repeat domain-containing protein [Proteobacteria bacterium]|jgi:ankyrin repeat protein|nr:ankyrin repeat domain-containing protein [Pseudomonadota bacterium]
MSQRNNSALPRIVALMGLVPAFGAWAADGAVTQIVPRSAPLVEAARARDAATAQKLLRESRAAAKQMAVDGTTALHWAVYNDDADLVDRLVAARADVNARNDYGATPLSQAAVVGNVRVIRRLVGAGADVEAANADGQTALMVLARSSNVEAARLLLKRGAKVDTREAWREQTALMWAAAEGQPDMVKLLIEHGADVNARSKVNNWERQVTAEPRHQARPAGGFTPLLYAARRGCVQCASLLVKAGAEVNGVDPDGVSPLLLATLNFSFDTAKFLIEQGADVNRWDIWGRAPLYAAVDMNTLPTGGRADRPSLDKTTGIELIAALLKAGANPNMQLKLFPPHRSLRDDRGADMMLTIGSTPLIRAAKAGDVPAIRLLLAAGAHVDLPTINGITPLMAAAGNAASGLDTRGRYKTEAQAVEAAELLLAAGANVNARERGGQTALHGATIWGFNSLIRVLATHRADLAAKDSQGRMAVDLTRASAAASGREGARQARPETEALLRELMGAAR